MSEKESNAAKREPQVVDADGQPILVGEQIVSEWDGQGIVAATGIDDDGDYYADVHFSAPNKGGVGKDGSMRNWAYHKGETKIIHLRNPAQAMGVPTCERCGKPVPADGNCSACGGRYVQNPNPIGAPSEEAKAFNAARALRHADVLLAQFRRDVVAHLVPRLPGRLRVVTDLIGAYPKHMGGKVVFDRPTFACFVLEVTPEGEREVYHFCRGLEDSYGPADAACDANNIGGRLLEREARGQ